MIRALLSFLLAAVVVGLWQWHRLHRLDQRQSVLAALIAEVQSVPAAGKPAASAAARQLALDASGAYAGAPGGAPVGFDEFFDLACELSRIEADATPGSDRRKFQEKLALLFARLTVTPSAQLMAIMEKLPTSAVSATGKQQIPIAIMNILAKSDPAAATSFALHSKASPISLEVAVRTWAGQDAAAAARWLEQTEATGNLPPSPGAEQLRLVLLPHQIAADPGSSAVDQLVRLQPANLGDLFAETARLLTTPDQRQAFLHRLTTVPGLPADVASQFLRQVGRESSVEEATALLNEVGAGLPPAEFDTAAVATITARIDAGTPGHAEWLLQNLRGPDREPAIARFVQAWTEADYNAAAAWLQQQPASADHDTAVAAFAPLVAAKEPPSAVDWAACIADPDRKAAVLASLYRDWHARAPEEAADYFQKKGLTVP